METSSVPSACYPLTVLPGLSRLFVDYLAGEAKGMYATGPSGYSWMTAGAGDGRSAPDPSHRAALAELLEAQNHAWHAGPATIANIAKLRTGARAVVTGQQVGLFGGPLYTLLKAATAVRLAREASERTGLPHVPIFWLATEDHDFAEVDHVALPTQPAQDLAGAPGAGSGLGFASSSASDFASEPTARALTTIRLHDHDGARSGAPVGALRLGEGVLAALAQAERALGASLGAADSPEMELLRRSYRPDATFAGAFAQWLSATFRDQGLIVLDAAGRAAHAMGASVLRRAITEADQLETLLLARGQELESHGYHQQVLVKPGGSLLFLLTGEAENEPRVRLPLKRQPARPGNSAHWTAGQQHYSSDELLRILESEPERLSPNALLRPVFQDSILPTAAYIGGPAEIAYFAQTAVLHRYLLGRETPVLPRLSATLLTAREAQTLEHDGIDLPEIFNLPQAEMLQRVGARNLPLAAKQKLHAAGTAMTVELDALTDWMQALDPALGRSAQVAASKMRYQMNRLRRLAAGRELQRNAGIARRINSLYRTVYPGGHLQERSVAAAAALAQHGPALVRALVEAAGGDCPGHKLLV
jgi:bacillithiol biosynthesis cysteine-adding enzyme BshC